jgi:hypothetical protein
MKCTVHQLLLEVINACVSWVEIQTIVQIFRLRFSIGTGCITGQNDIEAHWTP